MDWVCTHTGPPVSSPPLGQVGTAWHPPLGLQLLNVPNLITVLAIDSHVRAVESTQQTASLNDADNVTVLLESSGRLPQTDHCDLFLCNPPYYSDYRISELFLETAAEALRPGGFVHVVTKLTDWHENRMIEYFANAAVHRFGDYDVVISRR